MGGGEGGRKNVVVIVTDVVIHSQTNNCFSGVCMFGRVKRRDGGRVSLSFTY